MARMLTETEKYSTIVDFKDWSSGYFPWEMPYSDIVAFIEYAMNFRLTAIKDQVEEFLTCLEGVDDLPRGEFHERK